MVGAVNGLFNSAAFFSSLHAASSASAKELDKESSALGETTSKTFRVLAKEDRAHDDFIGDLESKIRNATSASLATHLECSSHRRFRRILGQFEKNRKPGRRPSFDALETAAVTDRYLGSVSKWGSDIAAAKNAHAGALFVRRATLCRQVAKSAAACADIAWRRSCEEVRQTGKWIGPTTMWNNFCASEGMPASLPASILQTSPDPSQGSVSPTHSPPLASESSKGPSSTLGSSAPCDDRGGHHPTFDRVGAVCGHPLASTEATTSSPSPPNQPAEARRGASPRPPAPFSPHPVAAPRTTPSAEPPLDPWRNHESPRDAGAAVGLLRQDSTASELSFVAKMKEVYQQQKAQADELGRRPQVRDAFFFDFRR